MSIDPATDDDNPLYDEQTMSDTELCGDAVRGSVAAMRELARRALSSAMPLYATAAQWLAMAAGAGDAVARHMLGTCYRLGMGVRRSLPMAVQHYTVAADAGVVDAVYDLGICHLLGTGVVQDVHKAVVLISRASIAGQIDASVMLGTCYELGICVAVDHARAFALFCSAHEQGNVIGRFNVARCCHTGIGTQVDVRRAFDLYEQCLVSDMPHARYGLYLCYNTGAGAAHDSHAAVRYCYEAARSGLPEAQYELARMLWNGTHGVRVDRRLASAYAHCAAVQGHARAVEWLGHGDVDARDVVPADDAWLFRLRSGTEHVVGDASVRVIG